VPFLAFNVTAFCKNLSCKVIQCLCSLKVHDIHSLSGKKNSLHCWRLTSDAQPFHNIAQKSQSQKSQAFPHFLDFKRTSPQSLFHDLPDFKIAFSRQPWNEPLHIRLCRGIRPTFNGEWCKCKWQVTLLERSTTLVNLWDKSLFLDHP
jgi:hypothetical protein